MQKDLVVANEGKVLPEFQVFLMDARRQMDGAAGFSGIDQGLDGLAMQQRGA